MRRSLVAVVTVAAVVLTGSMALAKAKGTNRPFKGASSGTTTASCVGATCDSDSAGTHNSSHLGKGTYTIDATQDWSDPTPETNGRDCAESVAGTVTLNAANGAKLVGDIVHNDQAVCEVSLGEEYASSFQVDVNGALSTGKYAGASGSYWLTGTSVDPDGPPGGPYNDSATYSGSITF